MSNAITNVRIVAGLAATVLILGGCSSSNGGNVSSTGAQPVLPQARGLNSDLSPDVSRLKQLKNQVVIGSTIDPINGSQNPYGLSIATTTAGEVHCRS